ASRLNTNDALADHRGCCDQLARGGFPAQLPGLSLQRVEESVLAAENSQVARDRGRGGDAQASFVLPAHFSGGGAHGVKEEIFRADENQITRNGRRGVDAIARWRTPQQFSRAGL